MEKVPPIAVPGAGKRERSRQSLIEQYGPGAAQSFRRISLAELLPNFQSLRDRVPGPLHKISIAVLEEYLALGGWFVTAAAGVYDVVYPNLPKSLADIKHSAIVQEIERQCQERISQTSSKSGARLSRELGRQDFEALRNGPRPTVALSLDITAILFDKPGDATLLSQRINKTVGDVLDEFLAVDGFFTRLPNAQIGLIFSDASRPLAQMKRDDIANEITRRCTAKDVKSGSTARKPAAASPNPSETKRKLVFRSRPPVGSTNPALADAANNRGYFDPDEARAMPAGWSSSYQPLWRVRNQLLTAYVLRGFPPDTNEQQPLVKDTPLKELLIRTDLPGQVDLPLLDIAARDIRRTMNQGRQAIVIVPVQFATLDRTNLRVLYLNICAQLPEEARKYLVPEIFGVPVDLAPFRIEERINQLRPFSRAILVRASLVDQQFRQWGNLGLHAVGVDMSQYRGSEADIMQGLEQFAEAAEGAKLHTYAYGIPSLSLTTATVVSGIDYIGGDPIAPPTRQPLRVAEFDTAMLYPMGQSPAATDAPCPKS